MNAQRRRLHRAIGLAALLCGLAGCSDTPRGTVSGTVFYLGAPLPSGSVVFHTLDKRHSEAGLIQPDGSYVINNMPAGGVKITVLTAPPLTIPEAPGPRTDQQPGGAGENPPVPQLQAPFTPIPPHYADPDNTPLTYTVKPGKQKHDIELQ